MATILKTGSSGMEKFRLLLIGVAVAAVKLIMVLGVLDVPGVLMHEELNISLGFIPDQFSPVLYLS